MLSSAGVAPLPSGFHKLLSATVTTFAVFPFLMYLLGGDDNSMLSVPSCTCDLHTCCWHSDEIFQATVAAFFTLFKYTLLFQKKQTCCMRENIGKCHPVAITAYNRKRPTRHIWKEAGKCEVSPRFFHEVWTPTTQNGSSTWSMTWQTTWTTWRRTQLTRSTERQARWVASVVVSFSLIQSSRVVPQFVYTYSFDLDVRIPIPLTEK